MDFVKSQLDRIQQQLSGLNASQKMLAACLVAIIVMTVAFWGGRAGTSERVPLYKDALEPAEAARIKNILLMRGIDATIGADSRVSVPAASWNEALGQLADSEAMPTNRAIDFEALMKGMNPFQSQSNVDASLNQFKQAQLAEAIREIRGVKSARVFINPLEKYRLGGAVEPSATVTIFTHDPKAISQSIVDGVAGLLKGAQAGLTWSNIIVTVDGELRRVSDPKNRGAEGADSLLALREQYQQKYSDDVAKFLMIPGVSVRVTFGMNDATTRTRTHTFDQKKSFSLESESSEKSMESTGGGGAPAGEPGAMPNVGMSVAGAAAGTAGATITENDAKTKFDVFPSDVVEESERLATLGPVTGAAVLIPRGYVAKRLKFGKQNPPEPDDAAIDAWLQKELPGYQEQIRSAVGMASTTPVSVGLYMDETALPDAAAAGAVSTASLAAMAGTHSREIMLGGLAVVSLFMVSMMVRKGGPAVVAVPAGIQFTSPSPLLDATEQLAGEVGEGKSTLNAMELDADAVHAQQMVDQVAAMVEDNPDAAAGLVKRWMSRA